MPRVDLTVVVMSEYEDMSNTWTYVLPGHVEEAAAVDAILPLYNAEVKEALQEDFEPYTVEMLMYEHLLTVDHHTQELPESTVTK